MCLGHKGLSRDDVASWAFGKMDGSVSSHFLILVSIQERKVLQERSDKAWSSFVMGIEECLGRRGGV